MEMILVGRAKGSTPFLVPLEDRILNGPHLVKLEGSLRDIVAIERQGNNLVIFYVMGKSVTLFGFYDENSEGEHSELVIEDESSIIWWLNDNLEFVEIPIDSPVMEGLGAAESSKVPLPFWLMGLLGAGAIAKLASSGSSSGNAGDLDSDSDSDSYQTRPKKPEDLEINNNKDGSTTVTGKGEPGAEIIITDKDDR